MSILSQICIDVSFFIQYGEEETRGQEEEEELYLTFSYFSVTDSGF